jgi:hypothetical protein
VRSASARGRGASDLGVAALFLMTVGLSATGWSLRAGHESVSLLSQVLTASSGVTGVLTFALYGFRRRFRVVTASTALVFLIATAVELSPHQWPRWVAMGVPTLLGICGALWLWLVALDQGRTRLFRTGAEKRTPGMGARGHNRR